MYAFIYIKKYIYIYIPYIYSDTRGITNTENTFTFKVFTVKNTV